MHVAYIYCITNVVNGKRYIGRTKNTLKKRLNSHFNSSHHGATSKLHAAIRKYGSEQFSISLLETTTVEEYVERERWFIAEFRPEYNMSKGGEGAIGGKGKHGVRRHQPTMCITDGTILRRIPINEPLPYGFTRGMPQRIRENMASAHIGCVASTETREKMSRTRAGKQHTVEAKINMRNAQLGRTFSAETKDKMRLAKLGTAHSDTTKEKMRLSKLGKPKSPETRAKMSAARRLRQSIKMPSDLQ